MLFSTHTKGTLCHHLHTGNYLSSPTLHVLVHSLLLLMLLLYVRFNIYQLG
jgi:hypothetical protein